MFFICVIRFVRHPVYVVPSPICGALSPSPLLVLVLPFSFCHGKKRMWSVILNFSSADKCNLPEFEWWWCHLNCIIKCSFEHLWLHLRMLSCQCINFSEVLTEYYYSWIISFLYWSIVELLMWGCNDYIVWLLCKGSFVFFSLLTAY